MILIVGATGQLGGRVVTSLRALGLPTRALVRPQTDGSRLQQAGAEIVEGDLRDPASLARACEGVDAVLSTANSARRSGADTVQSVDLDGTAALIDAAATAGVRRFIYVSVLGARADHPVPFFSAKGRNEVRLRESGLEWVVLAPNLFMESWPMRVVGIPARAGLPVPVVGTGRRLHTFVAERDVAAFATAALAEAVGRNERVPIGGPEALSWRDVVAVYERELGRPVEIRTANPGEPIPGVPPAVLPLLAATDTFDSAFDSGPVAATFGVRLTRLEEVIREE
jgi:NADH dehydrogenase